jgi:GNAT superfamily N-acetyltransferase
VVEYRTFRNNDTPRLVAVWNEAFVNRGAPRLTSNNLLERFVLAKPIFDPAGIILAEDNGECIGWAHAAMSLNPANPQPVGVICMLGVRASHRRQRIGSELLRRSEQYLRDKGAVVLQAGPYWPNNPFYLGLYGGSESPGFLLSDPNAEPFFLKHGYRIEHKIHVLQRILDVPMKTFDPRFLPLRQRFELQFSSPRRVFNTWEEMVFGYVDPLRFVLNDRQTGKWVARTLVWEMEAFSAYWQRPSIGIFGFEVAEEYRGKSVGRYFLALIMKYIQDQFFTLVELQLEDTNEFGLNFLRTLEFQHVDMGQVYVKNA